MKYDQYLEWQKTAKALIAKAMEKFTVKEGRNAQVFSSSLGIEVSGTEPDEPEEPTWFYVVYGKILTRETGQTFGPALAATIPRATPITVQNDSLFVGSTQVIDIPEEITRTKKITYYVTTFYPDTPRTGDFSNGVYRGGLKLTCEFYSETIEGVRTFIRNYTLLVGRNGDSVTISPRDPNIAYYLRIVSAERF
jgi:hypothetical protein